MFTLMIFDSFRIFFLHNFPVAGLIHFTGRLWKQQKINSQFLHPVITENCINRGPRELRLSQKRLYTCDWSAVHKRHYMDQWESFYQTAVV